MRLHAIRDSLCSEHYGMDQETVEVILDPYKRATVWATSRRKACGCLNWEVTVDDTLETLTATFRLPVHKSVRLFGSAFTPPPGQLSVGDCTLEITCMTGIHNARVGGKDDAAP